MDNRLREVEIELHSLSEMVRASLSRHEENFRVFYPLTTELALLRQNLERLQTEFGEDLREAHEAIRGQSSRLDEEHKERVRGQRERKEEFEAATLARGAEIAKLQADNERRYREIQVQAEQRKLENRKLLLGLVTIFVTSVTAVLIPIVSGGGG
jgi:hypothetical protein